MLHCQKRKWLDSSKKVRLCTSQYISIALCGSTSPAYYFLNKSIIDGIIGEMQFDPDDSTISRERALSMFVKDSDVRTDRYRFAVKNPIQFRLIIGFLSGRASFRMACRFLLLTADDRGDGYSSVGNMCVRKATSFVRFTCTINL
jgi:hypothetical protein